MKASQYVISVTAIIAFAVLIIAGVLVKSPHVDAKSARDPDSRVERGFDIAPVEGPQDSCSPGSLDR